MGWGNYMHAGLRRFLFFLSIIFSGRNKKEDREKVKTESVYCSSLTLIETKNGDQKPAIGMFKGETVRRNDCII